MRLQAAAGRRGLLCLTATFCALAASACSRPHSQVVPLAPEVTELEPADGTKLRGNHPLTHDRAESRFFYRRGRNDERQRLADPQAAHARLGVLDAQIEQEKARYR